MSGEAIAAARAESAGGGLRNIEFVASRSQRLRCDRRAEAYEFITTFDAVHDQAKPLQVLKGIHRALTPGGVYLMQDIKGSSHVHGNLGASARDISLRGLCMHCMTVSLAQGGEGLGAMWGEEKTREYLTRAGFRSVDKHELAHDPMNNLVSRRGSETRGSV